MPSSAVLCGLPALGECCARRCRQRRPHGYPLAFPAKWGEETVILGHSRASGTVACLRAVRKSVSAPELIQTLSFRPWSPAIFQAADNSPALATRFSARRRLSRSRSPATKHLCRCFPTPRRAHAPPRPPPNPVCRAASVATAGDCPNHPRRRQLQRLRAREHDHPRCVLRLSRAALCCSLVAAGMMN